MPHENVVDAYEVAEQFNDLAKNAEEIAALLDLIADSKDVPDRLQVAISAVATMADVLSDRAEGGAVRYRRIGRDNAEAPALRISNVGPHVGSVIPFSEKV